MSVWDWINFDWVNSLLSSFGFYRKKGKLLLLGLDDAGKTTLMQLLKSNKIIQSPPTLHATSEEFILGNIEFTTYDVGGHKQVRRVWKEFFPVVDAVVFIVDVSKNDRFEEAKAELGAILNDEDISECPILILGNKIDKCATMNEEMFKSYFNLNHLVTGKPKKFDNKIGERPLEIFMCSFVNRQGYGDGFRWLSQYF